MDQMVFDLDQGRRLRDAGAERAIKHADRKVSAWSIQAYALFREFIASAAGEFMAEDLRKWAHTDKGFPLPPDGRAWGAVLMKAARQHLIQRVGYAPMKSRNCHANPKTVWRILNNKQ